MKHFNQKMASLRSSEWLEQEISDPRFEISQEYLHADITREKNTFNQSTSLVRKSARLDLAME